MIDQLCRAASSIPINIAEGKGREPLEETRYLLLLSRNLSDITAESYAALESIATEISEMLNALIKSLLR